MRLKRDHRARTSYEQMWNRPFDNSLKIIHFFELLEKTLRPLPTMQHAPSLKGLTFVPYYGCMLERPPEMRYDPNYHGLMENILSSFGAKSHRWAFTSRCCGTFLSVAKPEVVTPMVNRIIQGASDAGAECIVTACSMCQLNLEIRSTLKVKMPIFHFSELLAIALQIAMSESWLSRHLVDPTPVLKARGLL